MTRRTFLKGNIDKYLWREARELFQNPEAPQNAEPQAPAAAEVPVEAPVQDEAVNEDVVAKGEELIGAAQQEAEKQEEKVAAAEEKADALAGEKPEKSAEKIEEENSKKIEEGIQMLEEMVADVPMTPELQNANLKEVLEYAINTETDPEQKEKMIGLLGMHLELNADLEKMDKTSPLYMRRKELHDRGETALKKMVVEMTKDPEKKTGISEEEQEKMRAAAMKDLKGLDPAKMDPTEKESIKGKVMMNHGVSISEVGGKFVVDTPKSGWDLTLNKFIGFMVFVGALFNKIQGSVDKAMGKKPPTSAEMTPDIPAEVIDPASAERVEKKLKDGKTLDAIKKETQQERDDIKKNIDGEKGLNEQLTDAQKRSDSLATNIKGLELQQTAAATPEAKKNFSDQIIDAQEEKKKVDAEITQINKDIEKAKTKLIEVEADLVTIAQKEKPADKPQDNDTQELPPLVPDDIEEVRAVGGNADRKPGDDTQVA